MTDSQTELFKNVFEAVETVFNTCYGTDPRHTMAATHVANKVVFGTPIPWSLADHFGMR